MISQTDFISWMNDAYAMEQDIAKMLEGQIDDLKDFPDLQTKVQEHLTATRNQAERLQDCIKALGGDISNVKSFFGQAMGKIGDLGSDLMKDKVLKYTIADYATENMEIATYKKLIVAANLLDHPDAVTVLQTNLGEEQDMADYLWENMDTVFQQYLEEK